MSDPRTIAAAIISEATHRDPRMPSDVDLVALARAYLDLATAAAQAANLHPSLAAVQQFSAARGMRGELERARRQLAAVLRRAKPTPDPSKWRVRSPVEMSLVVGPDDDAGTELLIVHSIRLR